MLSKQRVSRRFVCLKNRVSVLHWLSPSVFGVQTLTVIIMHKRYIPETNRLIRCCFFTAEYSGHFLLCPVIHEMDYIKIIFLHQLPAHDLRKWVVLSEHVKRKY